MMKKLLPATLILLFYTLVPMTLNGQDHPALKRIALWMDKNNQAEKDETKALKFLLLKNDQFEFEEIRTEFFRNKISPHKYPIIWMQKDDTLAFDQALLRKKTLSNILNYVKNGGNLLLSNQAFEYIKWLGVEPIEPETRSKVSKDEGYGRQLGFHAFRKHPVFEGLNGGSYVLKPEQDTNLLQTGYFGKNVPQNFKVVGVDWDYIFLRENTKLIVEMDYGKGKIFAVGGYMLYSMPNKNKQHLEKFTLNILNYLTGKSTDDNANYWYYGKNEVLPFDYHAEKAKIPHAEVWDLKKSPLDINREKASGNYVEVAGERILVMGNDRGGIQEIWTHPFMSFRDIETGIRFDEGDSIYWLNDQYPEVITTPESIIRNYKFGNGSLKEVITVSPDKPLAIIHYKYDGKVPAGLYCRFSSNFRLMWPYSEKVPGKIFYSWSDELNAFVLKDMSGDFAGIIGTNLQPSMHLMGQTEAFQIKNGNFTGVATEKFQSSGILEIPLKMKAELDIAIAASDEGLEATRKYYEAALASPSAIYDSALKHSEDILSNSLLISGPDTNFNKAYAWALMATDRFFVNTPGIGSSLTAGYATSDKGWDGGQAVSGRPGYGWYFGRDGEWSGMALLDYGDYEKVKDVLSTYQRFQDLNGKIYHELSTSGIVHYDAADATPLYIVLAGLYLRHSRDTAFIRESWPYLLKAIDFCYSTDTDGDHLIENTNVGHGWVEGGKLFGSHSSLYLSSCWAAALKEAACMAKEIGLTAESNKYTNESILVKKIISTSYWNYQQDYFYHGKMKDGTYMSEPTIMAAIPAYFGQAEPLQLKYVLPVLTSNAFTSDWGCRIIGEQSPFFNPEGYHTGSVWPLFTGWAALAEFRNGNYLQAYSHTMDNLNVYKNWGLGYIEEVLNGEKYLPSGVCHHQCWSETMALQPAIEGMLGMNVDTQDGILEIKPWFPQDWDHINFDHIRMGEQFFNLKVERKDNGTVYYFSKTDTSSLQLKLKIVLPPGSIIDELKMDQIEVPFEGVMQEIGGWLVEAINLRMGTTLELEVRHHGGICLLPILNNPEAGEESEGLRLLSSDFNDGTYTLHFEGQSGKSYNLGLWADGKTEPTADNVNIIPIEDRLYDLQLTLPEVDFRYAQKIINIKLPE